MYVCMYGVLCMYVCMYGVYTYRVCRNSMFLHTLNTTDTCIDKFTKCTITCTYLYSL